MEKNIIIAIVLSVAILVVYNIFFMPQPTVKEQAPQAPEQQEQQVTETEEKTPSQQPAAQVKPAVPQGEEITLENAKVRLTVNTEGGKITSWYLKDKQADLLQGDEKNINFYLAGAEDKAFDFNDTNFSIKKKENNRELVLYWESEQQDIKVTQTISLPQEGYYAFFDFSTTYPTDEQFSLACPTKIGEKPGDKERIAFWQGKLYQEEGEGVQSEYQQNIKWLGIRGQETITLMAPLQQADRGFFRMDLWGFDTSKRNTGWVIYAGPKAYTHVRLANNFVMESTGEDYHLTEALDIGFWGYLSVGLQKLLIFLYGFTGNYGLAIILLTLLIYGALSPLTFKQFESMQRMQAVQPELKEIQKKHKDEPKKMQAEMMKLYSKHKINPMAGCLPMLVQLPVIFILYRALLDFPFAENPSFLWINNLGEPNIPLLLGLAGCMFLQQRITQKMQPTSGEQAGIAKMMQFFPLFLIVILWSLPSGVMLYWFTSSLISIVQQFFIRKRAATSQSKG